MVPTLSLESLVHHLCKSRRCLQPLHVDRSVATLLIPPLVDEGRISIAEGVFQRFEFHTEISCNALIVGHVRYREPHAALLIYDEMRKSSMRIWATTFVALLKACAELRDVERGRKMHEDIVDNGLGLESHSYLGNTLVHMYSRCGLLERAYEVFDALPVRDVVSWTTLIAGKMTEDGNGEDSLECFEYMQLEGVSPNVATFACALKACSSIGAIGKGKEIHIAIEKKGLFASDLVIGNSLVEMYAKCSSCDASEDLFDKLPVRDNVSWTTLITGYCRLNHREKALQRFEQMRLEGIPADSVTYLCVLKSCCSMEMREAGRKFHSLMTFNGLLEKDITVGNTLIDMYVECGSLGRAEEVFLKLQFRDSISWNTLIAGYAKQDLIQETDKHLQQMQQQGIPPNVMTYVCCLKACGGARAREEGMKIHARIGFMEREDATADALIDMYAKCGLLKKAEEVFDNLLVRSTVSWTRIIQGCANHGDAAAALKLYKQMQVEGAPLNSITYVCGLKASGMIQVSTTGMEIHSEMCRKGLSDLDLVFGNAFIDMYAKCGFFLEALYLLDCMYLRDASSWNGLITGYTVHNKVADAVNCFKCMQHEGLSPDPTSVSSILRACGSAGAIDLGRNLHDEVVEKDLFHRDRVIGNALVDMYAKCGLLDKAHEVFDGLSKRDVVSWTALIAGYVKHEQAEEALSCYERMQLDGIAPDEFTYSCALAACGSVGAIVTGDAIHSEIARHRFLEDIVVNNALIDMYVRCDQLGKAEEVFNKLPVRGTLAWTALIGGYVQQGKTECVFYMLKRMREEGKSPDAATFVTILDACSHGGQVDDGLLYFEAMIQVYGIEPIIEHYSCMIDLVCRAGLLDRAITIIDEMPISPDPIIWCILLDACQKWGKVDLGRTVFEHVANMDKTDPSIYFCMCSINASIC